jgi:hypothetical protein
MRDLVVFGDSFVEGYYRKEDSDEIFLVERKLGKWLSHYLGTSVASIGFRGHSNVSISYDINTWVRTQQLDNVAFLIIWSDPKRSYMVNDSVDGLDQLFRVVGRGIDQFDEDKDHYGDCVTRWLTESAYNSTVNILNDHKIPFMMTNSISNEMFVGRRLDWGTKEDRIFVNGYRKEIDYRFLFDQEKIKGHYIEPEVLNNTLYDIVTNRWKNDTDEKHHYYVKSIMDRKNKIWESNRYVFKDLHPNEKGYNLIAKTIAPYIKPILEE